MSDHALSIVLPCHNEAASLDTLLSELHAMFPEAEILVVDDGSSDGSREICRQHACRLLESPYQMGNGAAIKRGARAAKGEILAFMDADGQHSPAELKKLLERFHSADYDMVVGVRSSQHQASSWRLVANKVFNRLASWVTGQKVDDLTSGFRVVRAEHFREFLHLLPNGFSYPTTSTMAFFRSGYAVAYEPVEVDSRVGNSHIRPLQDGMRFLLIIFRIGTLYSPLKLFMPISGALFLLATLLYSYTFLTEGRFTNMSALLYSTSLLTFLIGMVSEQITSLLFSRREP